MPKPIKVVWHKPFIHAGDKGYILQGKDPLCLEYDPERQIYQCTRDKGHLMPHVAHGSSMIVSWWDYNGRNKDQLCLNLS
jgi:hypothetical protein